MTFKGKSNFRKLHSSGAWCLCCPHLSKHCFGVSNNSELLVKEQRLFFIILYDFSFYDRKLSTAFDFRKTHFPPNRFVVGALIFFVGLVAWLILSSSLMFCNDYSIVSSQCMM